MFGTLRLALLAVCWAGVAAGWAQQDVARPQPLSAMPYSPTLDIGSLDRKIDPCVDFYEFSCGGWKLKNPIPADQPGWDVYSKLANDNQQFLWGILQEDAAAKDRTAVQQKVGDYFASCMDEGRIDALGAKPVAPYLAKLDGLKTRAEVVAALTELHHREPGTYFFGSGTGQDAIDSSLMIAEVGAGGLGLPDRDYYLKTDAKSVTLREQYVAYMQKLLGLSGESADAAKTDSAAVMRIETALAKASLTRVERRDPHKTYHFMTVAELAQLTPAVDWDKYLRDQGAAGTAKLNVSQPEFMKAVQAELTDGFGAISGQAVRADRLRLLFEDAARGGGDASAVEDVYAHGGPEPGRGAGAGVCAADVHGGHQGSDAGDDGADRSRDGAGDSGTGLDDSGDQRGGAAQASCHPQQDRLPGALARLHGAAGEARRLLRQCRAGGGV